MHPYNEQLINTKYLSLNMTYTYLGSCVLGVFSGH